MGFGKTNLWVSKPLVPLIKLGLNLKPSTKTVILKFFFNHLEMLDIFSYNFPWFSDRGIRIEQLCSIGNMEIHLELSLLTYFKQKGWITDVSIPPFWAIAFTRKGDTTNTFLLKEPLEIKKEALFWEWTGRSGIILNGQTILSDCRE